MVRKSKGRQKVEMVKMPNESNLQVTFSKRRSGLFKKASELCTLCGAEVALVVFSPGKKVFSFGHPCVDSVIDHYLTRAPPQISGTMQLIEAHRNASVRELNMQLTQVLGELEAEKKRGEELIQMRKASQAQCWWENLIEELSLPQLEQLKAALEELKKNVAKQAEKIMIQNSGPPQFLGASSSSGGGINLPFDLQSAGFNPNMMPPHGYNNPGFGRGFY
ncbi:agamous-like MADS-box protein AGL62 [Pistacia vera]|uniref:agamous-like MADS-box protein AGL62 n=1 Tax=Pistacia vera TaxID=55513 RepID=UPI001263D441|nr:agamous-like MADS-box protein AGL62 [Pistacia vera]